MVSFTRADGIEPFLFYYLKLVWHIEHIAMKNLKQEMHSSYLSQNKVGNPRDLLAYI